MPEAKYSLEICSYQYLMGLWVFRYAITAKCHQCVNVQWYLLVTVKIWYKVKYTASMLMLIDATCFKILKCLSQLYYLNTVH